MSGSVSITSPSDIPTLSDLYAQEALPGLDGPPYYPYNDGLNKRVSIWRGAFFIFPPDDADSDVAGDITTLKVG
jgi:hypothetical protein